MKVAVHQPQYMPYIGVIDKIDQADTFVFLDTVQFEKNEWQNRNRIKSATGFQWLTVPVLIRNKSKQKIMEVQINKTVRWRKKHKQSLRSNYSKAPYYKWVMELLDPVYNMNWNFLAALNISITTVIVDALGINTGLVDASSLQVPESHPDERLIAIVRRLGGDTYLAGVGGKGYMDLDRYEKKGVKVEFQNFTCPKYNQLYNTFVSDLSVLDLLFNHGPESIDIIRRNRECE